MGLPDERLFYRLKDESRTLFIERAFTDIVLSVSERREATITIHHRGTASVPFVRLEVVEPGAPPKPEITLNLEERVVGTAPDADIVLSDSHASRHHASLRLTEQGLLVVDHRSKNGTTIDGVRIQSAYAPLDAVIRVGKTRLIPRSSATHDVPLSLDTHFGGALGHGVPMRALFARLAKIAKSDETVVLLGESGTGKELLARGIHEHSARKDQPFVVVDCGAIPASLAESELFGHERGAFTGADAARAGLFEQADGGTIFLDEIGELPLDVQTRLLRALEQRAVRRVGGQSWKSVDVRVVAATHRDLGAMVRQGTFRADLYHRLAVAIERVPSLRERPEDIDLLSEKFLSSLRPPLSLDDLPRGTRSMLRAHSFPGNVRELFNVLRRLAVFPETAMAAFDEAAVRGSPTAFDLRLDLGWREARALAVDTFEMRYLRAQLDAHGGNVAQAASSIGVSRQFLYRLLERHGLDSGAKNP